MTLTYTSSHFHEDHFTKEIFEWRNLRQDITYILSKDILRRRRANKEDADVWLAKGGTWKDGRISVWALGSTDGFDVVMFPIDGRIGNGYTLGGRQFIERFKVGLFVPMHFTTGFESARCGK